MASDVVTFLATFLSWSEASLLVEVIVWSSLFALVNIYMYNNIIITMLSIICMGSGPG